MVLQNGITIQNSECIEKAIIKARERITVPTVIIRCISYNQHDYIGECLEGFVNQRTNFPFVALVHDDASTDKTDEIIRIYEDKYPDKIFAVCDNENRYQTHSLGFVMDLLIDAFNPKYIAICEGDDYWSDVNKLQKQVDYMEKHPECVMCHGDCGVINGSYKKAPIHYDDEPYFGPGHIHTYTINSLTTLYRYDAYKKIPNYRYKHNWIMGDYPLWIELSREGKFHYFPEIFGMYRVLSNSASHSTDGEKIKQFWACANEITKFYSDLYGFDYKGRSLTTLYDMIISQCYSNHDKDQAKKYWAEARKNNAISIKSSIFYYCNIFNQRWIVSLLYRLFG